MAKKASKGGDDEPGLWLRQNLTAAGRALDPAFEVDDLVLTVAGLLAAGRSVFLVGERGVGKTALVHELVRRAPDDEALAFLRGREVLQLSFALRASRLRHQPLISQKFVDLGDALLDRKGQVVPFFEDGDALATFGLAGSVSHFVAQVGGAVLAEGHPEVVQALFEQQPELEQLFVTVPIDEPSVDRTARMLRAWDARERREGRRGFDVEALEEALSLGHRFLSRARLPKKAFDLLSQTRATAKGGKPVAVDAVIDRFCTVHRTPRWLVDPKVPLDLDALEERFRDRLLGQSTAIDAVTSMIALLKAGLSDTRRPFGAFLFAGPTGVGKTHLAQLLATELFGSPDRMVRIDMADFNRPESAGELFGVPNAYVPQQARGVLTQRLMGHPFAVLLLDELEKAFFTIHDRLLPLLDEGSFVNGAGETVSLRSTIVIATTNAGAEVYRGHGLGFLLDDGLHGRVREVERRIQQTFRFELLNRFDRVVHFQPLDREHIREVARRELDSLTERSGFRRRRLALETDDAVLDWLAVRGYHPEYGARFLKRTLERDVTTAIADAVARAPSLEDAVVLLSVRRNRIRATLRPRRAQVAAGAAAPPPERRSTDAGAALAPDEIVEAARPLLAALATRERERDELLAQMNERGFWDRPDEREPTLERFRTLDVTVGVERRLARPLLRLREHLEEGTLEGHPQVGAIVGEARASLRRWEERRRVEGPSAVWLVLRGADALRPPGRFLEELVSVSLAWCRRTELAARVEAVATQRRELVCVVLEVEGLGASHYLAAEPGLHRRHRPGTPDDRVEVEVVPRGMAPEGEVAVRVHPPRAAPLGLSVEAEARVASPERGASLLLHGRDAATLRLLARDLEARWHRPAEESPAVARAYGDRGGTVTDPRTGAAVPWRNVLKGRLEPFHEAWLGAPHAAAE